MTNRKEPTLNAIRPEQDEIVRHRQRGTSKGRPASNPSTSAPVRPVVVKSPWGLLALTLAFIAIGFAGFGYWQLQLTQKALVSAEARIAQLEGQLEMTGDESTASMAAIQAKLKWADSEIRKLWGVSFDKNKKAIADNKQQLAVLAKGASSVDSKIKAALKGTTAEIRLINDLLDSQQTSMSDIERKTQMQLAQLQDVTDKVREFEKLETEFTRRIASNEEAIEAIDAFRRNINQQMMQLNGSASP